SPAVSGPAAGPGAPGIGGAGVGAGWRARRERHDGRARPATGGAGGRILDRPETGSRECRVPAIPSYLPRSLLLMTRTTLPWIAGLALAASLRLSSPAAALEECRLLRQPDIERDKIVFAYAGDLWLVPRSGGVASRLTTHEGLERFPKFSPDGQTIAFTAEYDGNLDAFTIPVSGGEPTRLTWHPDLDQV